MTATTIRRQNKGVLRLSHLVSGGVEATTERAVTVAPSAVSWLSRVARAHGVEAWLAGALPPGLPGWEDVVAQRPAFIAAHTRSLVTVREAGRALEAADIPWAVVKGPALSALYPRPHLRHYVDIDLLVPPSAFAGAVLALEAEGYRLIDRNWPWLEQTVPGQLRLLSPHSTVVDLHWSMLNAARLRQQHSVVTDELLARRVVSPSLQLPVLDPADALVQVALHAAHSGANRLVWLMDSTLAARAAGDIEVVVDRARAAGATGALGLVLNRARRVLGTPLPDGYRVPAWLGPIRAADRLSPLRDDPQQPSFARSVARAIRPLPSSTYAEVARHGADWLGGGARRQYVRPDWLDPDDVESAMFDAPDEQARRRYFEAVASDTDR